MHINSSVAPSVLQKSSNICIQFLAIQIIAEILLSPSKVRVHSRLLASHPCSKLWYFLRALDRNNSGWVTVTDEQLTPLNASSGSIYRWLQQGERRGFFWNYFWAKGKLFARLGGLARVCKFLKIESWGVTAEIPLAMLLAQNGRRAVATAITTQDLQKRSHFAADRQRSRLERKCFKLPEVDELLNQDQTSLKMTVGGIRGLIYRGQQRIFVGRRFVPFGVSQPTIGSSLSENASCGFSRWTVSRHLDKLEVKKRQIVQAKPEYKEIYTRLNQGATSWQCKSDADIEFRYADTGVIQLYEPNGDSSARREDGHKINIDRLHKPYQQTIWLPRCNIYGLNFELTSMRFARHKWKRALAAAATNAAAVGIEERSLPLVENSISPLDPPQEVTPAACSLRSAAGGQIKGSNFENSSNTDSEVVVEDLAKQAWYDAGAKLKALVEAKRQERLKRLRST